MLSYLVGPGIRKHSCSYATAMMWHRVSASQIYHRRPCASPPACLSSCCRSTARLRCTAMSDSPPSRNLHAGHEADRERRAWKCSGQKKGGRRKRCTEPIWKASQSVAGSRRGNVNSPQGVCTCVSSKGTHLVKPKLFDGMHINFRTYL
jgi:hypothetical protein